MIRVDIRYALFNRACENITSWGNQGCLALPRSVRIAITIFSLEPLTGIFVPPVVCLAKFLNPYCTMVVLSQFGFASKSGTKF